MGGNIANGSPIGDSAPVLMALGASVTLRHGGATRDMPLRELYLDYMKNQLAPGEFVQSLQVPLPGAAQQFRAYKISKRYDCDISALMAGLAIELDGERVRSASFVYGGMAAVVKHASQAEAAVLGQPWNEATVAAAMRALQSDFTPLSDMRASADYRRQVAGALLKRFWLETRTHDALGAPAVSVWADATA
jgi:xanthine dehydrogenase small subunit